MQYNMKNVFTLSYFVITLIEVSFVAVVCPCTREDETVFKFNSPRNILKVVKLRTTFLKDKIMEKNK